MKRYNDFFDNAPYWKVFLFGIIFFGAVTFGFFYCIVEKSMPEFTKLIMFKMSGVMGGLMGLLYTLIVYMSRQSAKFWVAAKDLENKLNEADTPEKIRVLIVEGFESLKKLASGTPHYYEIGRLSSMLIIKQKMLENIKSTTIIPNPTWDKTLELLQKHNTIRISTSDIDTFKKILDSIGLKYNTKVDGEELTRFTLELK